MSKKKTNGTAKNVKATKFVETIRRSNTSRRALFVAILTGLFVLYGVYAAFATLVDPTGSVTDGAAIAASQVGDATNSAAGGGCCGGGGGGGGTGGTAAPSGGGGGGCCGGGNQTEVKGAATVNGNVQEITVQVDGGYNPNVIEVKKSIPLKLTFERRTAGGCDSQISIPAINVFENLPTDGTVTYDIPVPNEAGKTIEFACGMNMLRGQIKVID